MTDEAVSDLLKTYAELNPPAVDEVTEEPSALEFMRYVARNRPFVIRGGAATWPAVSKWSAAYLCSKIDGRVPVAITPLGNADSVLELHDGQLAFVKPYEQDEPFSELLRVIRDQESASAGPGAQPESEKASVRYGQSQNDNMHSEYSELLDDVPADIAFARIALGRKAEAVNFWLGNSLSITSLHKDNYENIYAQIAGEKHFVLLPPVCSPCVCEQLLPSYTYAVRHSCNPSPGTGESIPSQDLVATHDEPTSTVPVATWDPDYPTRRATPFSNLACPFRVTLQKGDMLYLPAMWYHKVSQSCGPEGFCCAVNYWFDMDFDGPFWATNSFIRQVANA